MPAEVHRLERGIGSRDRLAIVVVTLVMVMTLVVGVAAVELRSQRQSATCISFGAAGVMGGGTWQLCGRSALAYCSKSRPGGGAAERRCSEVATALRSRGGSGSTR